MANEFEDLTFQEVRDLRDRVMAEYSRRVLIASAPGKADETARGYLDAVGFVDGAAWADFVPSGAHDAFYVGAVVTHDGKTWVNGHPANPYEPGVYGWTEQQTGDGLPPEWVKPGGAPGYSKDEVVTFEGQACTSTQDGNVWSPTEHPPAWDCRPPETDPTATA